MLQWGELECITDVTHHQAKHLISTSLCALSALCLGLGSRSVCGAFVSVFVCAWLRLRALVAILPGARYPSPSKQLLTGHSLGPGACPHPLNVSLGSLHVKGYHLHHKTHAHTHARTHTHPNTNHCDPNTALMPSLGD